MRRPAWRRAAVAAAALLLGGCALLKPVGLSEVIERPGERALLAGWRAYDEGQYAAAERELNAALAAGLRSAKDRATAHKLLAFVYCTSRRIELCEQAFRAARAADPAFALGRAEAGHPIWGPAYLRAAAL
jgi:Tfp pilus assembly protein PilF